MRLPPITAGAAAIPFCNKAYLFRAKPDETVSEDIKGHGQAIACPCPRSCPLVTRTTSGAESFTRYLLPGSAMKLASTTLSTRLITWLGTVKWKRCELTVTTYVSPTVRPGNEK